MALCLSFIAPQTRPIAHVGKETWNPYPNVDPKIAARGKELKPWQSLRIDKWKVTDEAIIYRSLRDRRYKYVSVPATEEMKMITGGAPSYFRNLPAGSPLPPTPPQFVSPVRLPFGMKQAEVVEKQRPRIESGLLALLLGPSPVSGDLVPLDGKSAANTLQEAAEMLLGHRQDCNFPTPSREGLVALSKACNLEAERGALVAKDLAGSMWAIAVLKDMAPEMQGGLYRLADNFLGRILNTTAGDVSKVFWATAKLRAEAPMLHAMLPVLTDRLVRTVGQLSGEDAASMIWAISTLRAELESKKLNMNPVVTLLASRLSAETLSRMGDQDFAELFWATAMVPIYDEELKAVMKLLIAELPTKVPRMAPEAVYTLMWSLGKQQELWGSTQLPTHLIALLLQAVQKSAASMTGNQMAAVIWSLGALDPDGRHGSQKLLSRIRTEVFVAIPELEVSELAITLWGLAAVKFRDEDILLEATNRAESLLAVARAPLAAKVLPQIAWAAARLDYNNEKLVCQMKEKCVPDTGVLRYLEPEDCHALLWAWDVMDPTRRFPNVHRDISAKVTAMVNMLSDKPYLPTVTKEEFDKEVQVTFVEQSERRANATEPMNAYKPGRPAPYTMRRRAEEYLRTRREEAEIQVHLRAAISLGQFGPGGKLKRDGIAFRQADAPYRLPGRGPVQTLGR